DRDAQFVHELRSGLRDDRRRPGTRDGASRDLHLQARVLPDAIRLRRGGDGRLLRAAGCDRLDGESAVRRQRGRSGGGLMHRYPRWPIHLLLVGVSFLMLIPFYWVLKTSVTGDNIFAYPPSVLPKAPHPFYYVDVWYYIPFARYFLNSVVVSLIAVIANVAFNAMAGYALTRDFPAKRFVLLLFLSCMMVPFQATIIPAYLITGKLGLLDSYWGLALPQCSTIVCIFVFKASFDAVPRSLIDVARIDGLAEWRII